MRSPTPPTPAAPPRRAPALWREISWVLLFKVAALTLLWYLFFGHAQRVDVTPARVQQTLFAPPPAAPAHGAPHHA